MVEKPALAEEQKVPEPADTVAGSPYDVYDQIKALRRVNLLLLWEITEQDLAKRVGVAAKHSVLDFWAHQWRRRMPVDRPRDGLRERRGCSGPQGNAGDV